MSHLIVIKPGALTTVQDAGRWGYQRFGVPVSGPMDPWAFSVANRLVGNEPGAPALEMTMLGGTFLAEGTLTVALCGAPMAPVLDGSPVPMGQAFTMEAGQTLRLGAASAGARTYLAAAGGFQVPVVMGSAATYLKGGFGGLEGRALRAGDRLPIGPPPPSRERLILPQLPTYSAAVSLRILWGPETDRFEADVRDRLCAATYTVTPQADRMGYRLKGPELRPNGAGLPSDPVPMGTLQVPGDGAPILLMADRQPTGGYPRLAVVITADLPLAGQLRPGHEVRFVAVSPEEAMAALKATF